MFHSAGGFTESNGAISYWSTVEIYDAI